MVSSCMSIVFYCILILNVGTIEVYVHYTHVRQCMYVTQCFESDKLNLCKINMFNKSE